MKTIDMISESAIKLNLTGIKTDVDDLIKKAEKEEPTYTDFLNKVLIHELKSRNERARKKRIKEAGFPYIKRLEDFDLDFQKAIAKREIEQLSEFNWINQTYNLMFFGPPGVGKTHLSIALAYKAANDGHKVCFTTMTTLIQTLRTKEISRTAKTKYNRIKRASLVIIDEVGYLPIERSDANLFFQLISELYEQTSIILTSNKGFEDWAEFLGDVALATAILDRLTYRCDIFTLEGKSYRLENRKSYLKEGKSK